MNNSGAAKEKKPAGPKRVISKRLRRILILVLGLFSLLLANGIYLSSVTWIQFFTGEVYEDLFYQYMFLGHLALGLLLIVPVIVFGIFHMLAAWNRRNRRAVKIGYALFGVAIVTLISGVLLTRSFGFDLRQPELRNAVYWAHIIGPLAAIWLYWLHRLVGPKIKWQVGRRIALATVAVVGIMLILQLQDPRAWNQSAPKEGAKYFEPSLARTANGNFIPARSLQNDQYCLDCHADLHESWYHSAHHFSSFNNPAYLYSVRKTREKVLARDGSIQASRWCAGCHDPVPFFSGAFDREDYDDVNDPTSQAGITCTVCHAITHVESTKGNADYVIEEPVHYPFAFSDNPILKQLNHLLVKAKPGFHKKTFLKPLHKTAEFCSTCHKVHLPKELTAYKEFLRGQNHYDSFLLSGVSGHGASSFYYPEVAETDCNGCHMPEIESNDFGAKLSKDGSRLVVHDHFFPGANTALPYWRGDEEWIERAKELLLGVTRVDIFGVRPGGRLEDTLVAPLGPEYPTLNAGSEYLLETVIRTTKLGHHLTQGTVDSNELWLELEARSNGKTIGYIGGMGEDGTVDPWSHFVNVFMLDREGNRVAERNAEDIFVPLYNHQIPPGAGQTVHFGFRVPDQIDGPIELHLKLNYRKFDKGYTDFMRRERRSGDHPFQDMDEAFNRLPVTVMAEDHVIFNVRTQSGELLEAVRPERATPVEWQRWNDYGIGLLLSGKSQLRQAAEAFQAVEELGRYDGPLNLGRVQFAEGDLDAATDSLRRASGMSPAPPEWTVAWLNGEISRQQGYFQDAADSFRSVLFDQTEQRRERKFDFSLDYRVRNAYGQTLLDLADISARQDEARSRRLLEEAKEQFLLVLESDVENVTAHANLATVYERLQESELAEKHRVLQLRYKPDDNAADLARPIARRKYPAADHAAESSVIYWMHRKGAPKLPDDAVVERRQ